MAPQRRKQAASNFIKRPIVIANIDAGLDLL